MAVCSWTGNELLVLIYSREHAISTWRTIFETCPSVVVLPVSLGICICILNSKENDTFCPQSTKIIFYTLFFYVSNMWHLQKMLFCMPCCMTECFKLVPICMSCCTHYSHRCLCTPTPRETRTFLGGNYNCNSIFWPPPLQALPHKHILNSILYLEPHYATPSSNISNYLVSTTLYYKLFSDYPLGNLWKWNSPEPKVTWFLMQKGVFISIKMWKVHINLFVLSWKIHFEVICVVGKRYFSKTQKTICPMFSLEESLLYYIHTN